MLVVRGAHPRRLIVVTVVYYYRPIVDLTPVTIINLARVIFMAGNFFAKGRHPRLVSCSEIGFQTLRYHMRLLCYFYYYNGKSAVN